MLRIWVSYQACSGNLSANIVSNHKYVKETESTGSHGILLKVNEMQHVQNDFIPGYEQTYTIVDSKWKKVRYT